MDLTEALKLAQKGRGQAEAAASLEHASSLEPSAEPRDDGATDRLPVRVPEPPDLRLTRAEWYGHVSNVARALAENTGRPHWYDLTEKEREELRELAVAAILAVGSADVALKQRRIHERLVPIPDHPVDPDLEGDLDLGREVRARDQVRRQHREIIERAVANDEAAA